MHSPGGCQRPLLYGTGGCGTAAPPGMRKPPPQQNTFSELFFWYKINAKAIRGRELWRWGQPPLPRPQIMATLSGAQLRWVDALLLPEDLQARPGAGCRAATSVSEETTPNS